MKILILARSSRADESSSEHSQRRSYSSTGSTEFVSTSTIPKSTSETESDIKKRSRSFVRPPLRSAVPDSQLLSFARRPAQTGHRKIKIEFFF